MSITLDGNTSGGVEFNTQHDEIFIWLVWMEFRPSVLTTNITLVEKIIIERRLLLISQMLNPKNVWMNEGT